MKPDSILVIVWWLWLVPALMVLLLPLEWYFALITRGLDSVLSSGIGGDGLAALGRTAVPFIFGFPPFVVLSPLYGLLFWRHRQRGITLSARFWVPICGGALLLVMLAGMVVVSLSRERQEYWMPLIGLNSETFAQFLT
jgi:hypothetical protein